MRCFIAVDIHVDEEIKSVVKELKQIDPTLNLVKDNIIHVTLAFLGEIQEKQKAKILNIVNKINKKIKPFDVEMKGLVGISPSFLRVISIGTDSKLIEEIRLELVEKLKVEKYEVSSYPAHITLARIKNAEHRKELLEFIDKNKKRQFGLVKIDKVKLKKSDLTAKGPVYTDLN